MGRSRINSDSPSSSSSSSAESSFRELDDVFLQTQTRIWLGEVLLKRLDDQLAISDLLADGELLFEVSKSIWTMLLAKCKELRHVKGHKYKPIGSRKSSGRYRPYSNVDSFLKICKILGLNGIDLFSPSDAVEKRDTRKVCMCIRSLSKRARSKQLNVPDFDIVTYAVAMPTNLVGCLRRTLELSQCSFKSSANDNPCKNSASKVRQKNQVAAFRKHDSYFEASDDSESIYMEGPSYSSSTNYSHDTALLSNSDEENSSPGVSSVVKKYASPFSVSQEDFQGQEKEEYEQGQHNSPCSAKPCDNSQKILCARVSHLNNEERNVHEMAQLHVVDVDFGIGNDASIVGDSLDDISNQLTYPDLDVFGTDNKYPFLFDGEDSMFNILMGTDSHGSNSTGRTFQNGPGRRSSDNFEDVEVSSSSNSFSSVLDRALNLDFDDQSNADDLTTAKTELINLQNCEADSMDSSSTRGYEFQGSAEYENSVDGLVCETKLNEDHHACIDRNEDLLNSEYINEDESKREFVDNVAEHSGGRKYRSARVPHGKPHRKPLLRTVVEGTTLFGILCLLLHLSGAKMDERRQVMVASDLVMFKRQMAWSSHQGRSEMEVEYMGFIQLTSLIRLSSSGYAHKPDTVF
ncbi:unnamed protein product [Camellia sinensis]